MDLVVGSTGLNIILQWSSILTSDTKVVIATLNPDIPYRKLPYLCWEATECQRKYEVLRAFEKFGTFDITFLSFPSMKEFDSEMALAHLQMLVLLFRISTLYCAENEDLLFPVCNNLQGIKNFIIKFDSSDFTNKKKKEALLEFKEILCT